MFRFCISLVRKVFFYSSPRQVGSTAICWVNWQKSGLENAIFARNWAFGRKNANLGDFLKCLNNNELQNTLVFSVCQQGTSTGSERYFDLVRKVRWLGQKGEMIRSKYLFLNQKKQRWLCKAILPVLRRRFSGVFTLSTFLNRSFFLTQFRQKLSDDRLPSTTPVATQDKVYIHLYHVSFALSFRVAERSVLKMSCEAFSSTELWVGPCYVTIDPN